jgi:hypothetical protein
MPRVVLVVFVLVIGLAAPAFAQSDAPEGDGGLHVCCGGMVGSVGGSGSISGTVRGPGAPARASNPAPAKADTAPSAVTDGAVAPAKIEPADESLNEAPTAATGSAPNGPLLAALIVAIAAAVLFLRPRSAHIS